MDLSDRQMSLQELTLLISDLQGQVRQAPRVARAATRSYWTGLSFVLIAFVLVFGLLAYLQATAVRDLRRDSYQTCLQGRLRDESMRKTWSALANAEQDPALIQIFQAAAWQNPTRTCEVFN